MEYFSNLRREKAKIKFYNLIRHEFRNEIKRKYGFEKNTGLR